jgi:hypothetical protein
VEFIARVTSHLPDKGRVTVRYYGLYANAHRGKVRKFQLLPFVETTLFFYFRWKDLTPNTARTLP